MKRYFSLVLCLATASCSSSDEQPRYVETLSYTIGEVCESFTLALCYRLVVCGMPVPPEQSCSAISKDTSGCCSTNCSETAHGYCELCIKDLSVTSCDKLLPGGPDAATGDIPSTCSGCLY
jgi:hypothetical protein